VTDMDTTRSLAGKVAVVTGASRGIGACIATSLAAQGASVALVARTSEQIDVLERHIRATGGMAIAIPCDVRSTQEVDQLSDIAHAALGPVHILVNAAGVFGPIQLIAQSNPTSWIDTIMVNTVGPYLTCRAFASDMIAYGWGRIINVTSAASLHTPGPLNSAYGTSKAALNQFTRHLAAELAGTGVTANVIHPGEVKTEMWSYIRDEIAKTGPEGEDYRAWSRWVDETGGDPLEKSAELVLRLVSDEAASLNGQFLWIENGLQKPSPSW
jgi:NAD(P)-dependent dehydrogenase (short-subunit alcohol dehydrogenase family)